MKADDRNEKDHLKKLLPEEGLEIVGKVVVVYGTTNTVIYPGTVATTPDTEPFQNLPIVCGVFSKVTAIAGEVETGEIPGPIGDPEIPPETPEVPEIPETSDYPEDQPRTDTDNNDDDDSWYDRLSRWWRNRWNRERRDHENRWGIFVEV